MIVEEIKNKIIQKIPSSPIAIISAVLYGSLTIKEQTKDFATTMLEDGEHDYEIGVHIMEKAFYDKAVYHFQQSVEKAIKVFLISLGEFKKTHFVDIFFEKRAFF